MVAGLWLARNGHYPYLYSFIFIEHFEARAKRYGDDIFTVSLASQADDIRLRDVAFLVS